MSAASMGDGGTGAAPPLAGTAREDETEYLTLHVGAQIFGIPVLAIQDVLKTPPLTRVPLAPPAVAGVLNLRGRILTAIDLRTRLSLPPRPAGDNAMSVVVEHGKELYDLIVDRVGEVRRVRDDSFEPVPANLDPNWAARCAGVHRLDDCLLLVFAIDRLLDLDR